MDIDEQIEYLNETVRCRLGVSNIAGVGVFALRDFHPGEDLYVQKKRYPALEWFSIPLDRFKDIRPEIRALILDRWAMPRGGGLFHSPNDDQNLMSFMNHSTTPNSRNGKAIQDIAAGDEITEDYTDLGGELCDLSKEHYAKFL